MVYRSLGIVVTGLIVGVVFSRRCENVPAGRIARAYYLAVAGLLCLGFFASVHILLLGSTRALTITAQACGSITSFIFGAVFGLAIRRHEPFELIGDLQVLSAVRIVVAFSFAFAGVSKAFGMPFLTQFFIDSGYTATFLKFIMIAETLGGVGLLVPWAMWPALAGLTVDMFGAIVTHVHNGDPLDDSAGAVNMLLRLVVIAFLLIVRRGPGPSSTPKPRAIVAMGIAAVVCLLIAVCGSKALRHPVPTTTKASLNARR